MPGLGQATARSGANGEGSDRRRRIGKPAAGLNEELQSWLGKAHARNAVSELAPGLRR